MSTDKIVGIDVCEIRGLVGDLFDKICGENGREWLEALKRFLKKENPWGEAMNIVGDPKIIQIDRSNKFSPVEFLGKGWTIEEEDKRSLKLTEVDLTKIRFETCLKVGEGYITGEEKLKRLKSAGHIRLDVQIFLTLWKNQHLIPDKWKEKTNGNTTYFYFDGTVLRGPGGNRYVLCLGWSGGRWGWGCFWLVGDWSVDGPSAVLAS